MPIIGRGDKVLVVGDSLAQGLAPQLKGLAATSGVEVGSISEVSTRMQQWVTPPRRAALEKALASLVPTVVLVSLGTNDNKTGYTDKELTQQLAELLTVLRATGATVVWMLAPPMPFADRIAPLLATAGVQVIDTQAIEIPRGPDDIHPTARGYAAWAEWVWGKLSAATPALSGWGKVGSEIPSASFVSAVRISPGPRRLVANSRPRLRGRQRVQQVSNPVVHARKFTARRNEI